MTLWIITVITLLGGILFWLLRKQRNYLEDLGIPFIRVTPFQLLFHMFKGFFIKSDDTLKFELQKYKHYGRVYGTTESGKAVISIGNPDILRNIFIKDFHIFTSRRTFNTGDPVADSMVSVTTGEKWKRIRTIITPAFSTGKIKRMTDIIIDSAKTLVKNFIENGKTPTDAKQLFSTFTMDVIASTAFATKIYSFQDPNNRFVQEANAVFPSTLSFRLIILFMFPKLSKYFEIGFFPSKTIKFFADETIKIIADRRKNGKTKNDFLQMLLDVEKEGLEEEEHKTIKNQPANLKEYADDRNANELGHDAENSQFFQTTKKYKSLSQDEILAQCVTFFLAGYDTTATTLTCVFYALATHPKIQEKLRKEVDDKILEHDGKLTYEAVQEMKYLDNVLSETLRLYPAVIRTERVAEADYKIEELNITIKKDTLVAIPIYAMHRDPEFYPDPETFRPERFQTEEKGKRHPYSYITFGAGPRNCLGMRFALMEMKLCIAYTISQIIINRCSETKVPLDVSAPLGILKPNVKLTVEERNDKVYML